MRHAKSHHAIKAQFRLQAEKLSDDIRCFGELLKSKEEQIRLGTIGNIKESEEKGPDYAANILPYLDGIDSLKDSHDSDIRHIADSVTSSIHFAENALPRRKFRSYRRDIWLQLNGTLVCLGGRPSKKFSSLLLYNDQLLSWDVNHLCYGIPRDSALYVKGEDGERGRRIWCAERNNPAKFLGIAAVMPASNELLAINAAVDRFTPSLIGAALHHPFLDQCSLVSSHYPCVPCANVLAPITEKGAKNRDKIIGELIAYWNEESESRLTAPDRETIKAQRIIRSAGINENLRVLRN